MKVRIWDGNNKRFEYPEAVELNAGIEYEISTEVKDREGTEVYVGDLYQTLSKTGPAYQVFLKGGAICGGITEGDAIPLFWELPGGEGDENSIDDLYPTTEWFTRLAIIVGHIHEKE